MDTYQECLSFIDQIPSRSPVRVGFIKWLEDQLIVAKEVNLLNDGMAVCSDTIESMFGVAKRHGTSEIKDANRIALRIPSLCGELNREDVDKILSISTKEQRKVEDPLHSLIKQRRQILPNPGSLEKIYFDESKPYLELIPRPKNQSNNENIGNFSTGYLHNNGPAYFNEMTGETQSMH